METRSVVLTFESVDEIRCCYHSNETLSAVLFYGTFDFQNFPKRNLDFFLNFDL